MNNGPNRIFDEFAKLMTDAAGVAQGVKGEAETAFKAQAERMLSGMDLVKRDEFDAVREMAINAREENDALSTEIELLKKRLKALEGDAKKAVKPAAKSAAKTVSAKTAKKAAPKTAKK